MDALMLLLAHSQVNSELAIRNKPYQFHFFRQSHYQFPFFFLFFFISELVIPLSFSNKFSFIIGHLLNYFAYGVKNQNE